MSSNRLGRLANRPLATTLAALALAAGSDPALAGQGGNLQPAGTLLLELDWKTSRFRLDDGDGDLSNDRFQTIFDEKLNRYHDACLVGLAPPRSAPKITPGNAVLVSLPGSPGGTSWGIDQEKLALGSRSTKGTGCGQIEYGEVARLETALLLGSASIQVEVKQDVSARVRLFFDDGVTQHEVGRRYLLSGKAVKHPPAEVAAAPPGTVSIVQGGRPDGGPDSRDGDDGFWVFEAPVHNVEVFEILRNADGRKGMLSLKGGGEFPTPAANRSEWTVHEVDGVLACGDDFSCAGDETCVSPTGTLTGNRTGTGTGDACTAPIPFGLEFDGRTLEFGFLDFGQNPGIALDVVWETEAARFPIAPTILSYDPDGVSCESGSCSNDGTTCEEDADCGAGNTCIVPVTESCIPLTLCVGTPVRRCSHDANLGCREDGDCGAGNTCRLADLVAPDGGFPDLVSASAALEYGCVCEEDLLYLGGGICDAGSGVLEGTSCEADADCGPGGVCERLGRCDAASGSLAGARCAHGEECSDGTNAGSCVLGDEVAVDQCLFFVGDPVLTRGGGGKK